jgi:proline iminopeptidase
MIPIQTPMENLKFGPLEPTKLKSYCSTVVLHDTWNVLKLFFFSREFYEYDQLGSYYSDQPKDSTSGLQNDL